MNSSIYGSLGNSYSDRFYRSFVAMLLVYLIGCIVYHGCYAGVLSCSMFFVLFPVFLSWFIGFYFFQKNPETIKFIKNHSTKETIRLYLAFGFVLFLGWSVISATVLYVLLAA